jgi:hypothetical protein
VAERFRPNKQVRQAERQRRLIAQGVANGLKLSAIAKLYDISYPHVKLVAEQIKAEQAQPPKEES